MIDQLAQLAVDSPRVVRGDVGQRERQAERGRERHVAGRLDAEEPLDERVGHLIVLRAADAVQKNVAQAQAGKQRRDQGPSTEFEAPGGQLGQLCGGPVDVSLGLQRQGVLRSTAVGDDDLVALLPDEQPAAARVASSQIQNGASSQSSSAARSGTGWAVLRM